ncbi:conserved hypothetical protein [Talaromyces stipitatus ATCC 10500]|uniref:Xylanolytic transcriptional activator regulatory domain-containing protein n=1 Tax=Talaromyces stipitatus (strain ATCC 10500 / CBS 375.48 / QM 6759 / NRRL 1006) TaxID=441959 RepID=B8MMA1_TALSN|nr:uncharacterized protein TSTA_099100 [Talaromyces stipitatus ATCC 10500]EED13655.1 conserved hypothetical protein [Talaromyces stipitatus ATCC 10500]
MRSVLGATSTEHSVGISLAPGQYLAGLHLGSSSYFSNTLLASKIVPTYGRQHGNVKAQEAEGCYCMRPLSEPEGLHQSNVMDINQKRPRSETVCTWASDSSRVPYASPGYIRQLEDRIRFLEGFNGQIQDSNNRSIGSASEQSIPRTPVRPVTALSTLPEPLMWETSVPWAESTGTDLRLSTPATLIVPPLTQSLPEALESTDSAFIPYRHSSNNTVIGAGHRQDPVAGSYSENFIRGLEKAITEKLGEASSVRDPGHISRQKVRQKDFGHPLPARQQADILLSSYWNHVHVLYPILDKPHIEEDYGKICNQENSITDKKSFLCLLNSIFAISSRHIKLAGPDHEHLAATFCLRARELLDIESCSIRSVQSYLLLALYYQSIFVPRTCLMFAGLALRTAQVLELHLIEKSERESVSRTKNLLRKVWHGCVLVDREVSMMYDRACMIDQRTAAAIPLPLFDEEETQLLHPRSHTTQVQQTRAAEFYSVSLRLLDILHDILFHTHSSKSQRCYDSLEHFPSFEANSSVLELEARLANWENKIPRYYKVGFHSPDNDMNGLLLRRAVILRQRHLYVHLLLLRPMLQCIITSELRNNGVSVPAGSLLSHRVSLQCAIVCVKVAQEAIDIIHVNEGTSSNETRDLSAWWYNAEFLYTSATVLIAASLSPSVVAEIPEDSIYGSFHKAIAVLRQYTTFDSSILRLTTALQILTSIIPKNYSQLRQASQRTQEPTSHNAYNAATFQYWCPVGSNHRQKSPQSDLERHMNSGNSSEDLSSQSLSNLELFFDLDDFTWLTKVPFYT